MIRPLRRLRASRTRTLLSRPRGGINVGVHYDPDAFGHFSESIARLLGTGRYLAIQTGVVIVWITFNAVAVIKYKFDPYPFILLTLALSLQAAYAAPLILLAQNRQAERDRVQSERDRQVSQRTQAEAEFLARELATVRLQLADVVSNADLDRAIDRLSTVIERQMSQQQETRERHDDAQQNNTPNQQ